MRVNSFLERGANLAQYRTYAWAPADRLSTGDPRLDNNEIFLRRLQSGVDNQLAIKGFGKADADAADVIVHYHLGVTQQITVSGADQDDLRCETPPRSADVYDKGSLVLDLVDRRRNRLVWRSWATTSFDNLIDEQRLSSRRWTRPSGRSSSAFRGKSADGVQSQSPSWPPAAATRRTPRSVQRIKTANGTPPPETR